MSSTTQDRREAPEARRPGATPARPGPESMPNVLGLVIGRELRARGYSKGFLLSTAFVLVLVLAGIVLPTLLGGGPTSYSLGSVGDGNAAVVDAATRLANVGVDTDARTTIDVAEYSSRQAAEQAVDEGTVEAALVDGTELLVTRSGGFGSSDLVGLLQRAAGAREVRALVGPGGADRVEAALTGDALEVTALSGQDEADTDGRALIAYGGLVLTYLLILQYGTWTLSGVVEEKSNRVIEILLSTARPWQLFAGKVIGVALLGLGQFLVTLVAALVAIRVTGAFELPAVPVDVAATLTLWVLVGFAIYLVLFGAAGALAAKMEDAQSATMPISLLVIASFFASFSVLSNPDGLVALIGTFVPFSAPFVVPIRFALNAVPLWQQVLALAVAVATTAGLVLLAGRVYRGGALRFGGKLGWGQALRGR